MTNNNGASGTQSVAERLLAGIAAVSKIPSMVSNAEKRDPDEKVLATCDDFLQRVRVYHSSLVAELEPLNKEGRKVEGMLIAAIKASRRRAMRRCCLPRLPTSQRRSSRPPRHASPS